MLYFTGQGTTIDKKKAAYWVEKSYNNGSAKAKTYWEQNQLWKYKSTLKISAKS
jgi:TPR repeat protein